MHYLHLVFLWLWFGYYNKLKFHELYYVVLLYGYFN